VLPWMYHGAVNLDVKHSAPSTGVDVLTYLRESQLLPGDYTAIRHQVKDRTLRRSFGLQDQERRPVKRATMPLEARLCCSIVFFVKVVDQALKRSL